MLQLGCGSQKANIANIVLSYSDLHKQMRKARLQKERDDEVGLWTVWWQLLHKTSASSGSWLQREQPAHLQGRVSCTCDTSAPERSQGWYQGLVGSLDTQGMLETTGYANKTAIISSCILGWMSEMSALISEPREKACQMLSWIFKLTCVSL